jgi:hypothetical protein
MNTKQNRRTPKVATTGTWQREAPKATRTSATTSGSPGWTRASGAGSFCALQDVEDALTRYADERKRNDALRKTLAEAQNAADIARAQYRAGLVDFTPVLTAQGTLLDTQNQIAQSDGSLDRNLVSLYKALGGGGRSDGPAR